MSRLTLLLLTLACCLGPALGCTICQNPEDRTYAAFGGVWERQNPSSGRVGSVFEPAEGMMITRGQSAPQVLGRGEIEMEYEDDFEYREEGELYYEDYERTQFAR